MTKENEEMKESEETKKEDACDMSELADFMSQLSGHIKEHQEAHTFCENIKFPLEITDVKIVGNSSFNPSGTKVGDLVSVKPCGDKYKNKTYLGIYLGDLPADYSYMLHNETKNLKVQVVSNPAMYVFELKEIIYGCGSYWYVIKSIDDFKEITDEQIENTWYVKLLKEMGEQEKSKEEQENEDNNVE